MVDGMINYLKTGRNLLELNLSSNRIGDQALTKMSQMFEENSCRLQRLILVKCKISSQGAGDLFYSLRNCTHLQVLNLSENNLSGKNFQKIVLLLWNNNTLRKLILSDCMLGKSAIDNIGEGFKKNNSLHELNISKNMFETNCMESWNSTGC